MSLAITFATAHGIVMAADRCITTTLVSGKSFVLTDQERKLFLADCGYAFSYTGDSSFGGKPISYWMNRFINRFDRQSLDVAEYVKKLCRAFHSMDAAKNVIIIGSGYEGETPVVCSCNSNKLAFHDSLGSNISCITYSGENELAGKIIDAVPLERDSYTIPDAIDFVKHVILTVSNIQRFGQTPITVSPDCDVLVITPNGARWIIPPVFLD